MIGKQKVLIVDDDENIAELISLYLIKECYDTRTVGSGEEALQIFDVWHPNMVLLDLMLPGMDGYQVCREIRARDNTPVIMLSAKGEVFDKVLGLEMGADDYMIKPFDAKELVARVKSGTPTVSAGHCSDSCRRQDQMCRIRRSGDQSDQLCRDLQFQTGGNAAERTGVALFSGCLSQSGLHPGTVAGSDLGL